jgi:hypothetical protein
MLRNISLPLLCMLLGACAPDTAGPTKAAAPSSAPIAHAPKATAAVADDGPSYEVSIASAAADRAHALDECSSKSKPQRAACTQAADAAFNDAKGAAEIKRKAAR